MIKVSIIGASGYTGLELLRILTFHPEVELKILTSRKLAGQKVSEVFPWISAAENLEFSDVDIDVIAEQSDFVFTGLPHKVSMELVTLLAEKGKRVIDLSADFRFRSVELYEKWYQKHISPELTIKSAYGLPELYREEIKTAQIVGNPGCYPTSAILALIPLLTKGLIEETGIVVDSKSGVSGAGRSLRPDLLYCEVNDGFRDYGTGTHRHSPEINEHLSLISGKDVQVFFSPHLVPMNRGILSTIYAQPAGETSQDMLYQTMKEYYAEEPFVRITQSLPNTAHVKGSNYCDITVRHDSDTGRVTLVSVIDNLVKGASGQAVQNLNIMAGCDETTGIMHIPLFP